MDKQHCPDDCECKQYALGEDVTEVARPKPVKAPGAVLSIRFNAAEFEALCDDAEKLGLKVSTYIKQRVLERHQSPASPLVWSIAFNSVETGNSWGSFTR